MSKNRTSETPAPVAASSATATPERMTFLVVPRFNMATMITMIEVMRIANYLSPAPLYAWQIVSFDGPQVVASNGLTVGAPAPADHCRRGDTLFVLASWNAESYRNPATLNWLRRSARAGARLCSVELGCYLMARAGLLADRRSTTHWSWLSGFQEEFGEVDVCEQLFTIDGQLLTCAGGIAGVDLMLSVVGDRHGERLAGEIADQMLHHPIRPAAAPQRRTMGRGMDMLSPVLREAITLIEKNIADPMSVPRIAAELGVSQRQLERQFKAKIGCSVVQFGLLLRLQHARVLLISTTLSVREIAAASGFNTLSHFAYSFGKCFGRRPSDYRQAWPEKDAAPSWPGTLSNFLEALENRGSAKPMQIARKSGR
ncbi:MAG: GlxA family transcriptional regulator [Hyphomicrobiaceae bacterium]